MLRDVTGMKPLCDKEDLIPNAGVCALHDGEQMAIFFLPDHPGRVLAIGNSDPFTGANVLSRGIVGSISGRTVVASPIYKQHFDLETGQCVEDDSVSVKTFSVDLVDDKVLVTV